MPFLWAVRTKVAPFSLDTEIQQEVRATSGGLAVAHVRSMEQVVGESTARGDFDTMLLSIFAGVALLLAAIGVYGLMAYAVQQRTQEIGIRMALGASPEKVRKMVVWQGMRLAVIGVVIGVVAALSDRLIDPRWTEAVVFALLVVILIFRPTGLLGEETAERA